MGSLQHQPLSPREREERVLSPLNPGGGALASLQQNMMQIPGEIPHFIMACSRADLARHSCTLRGTPPPRPQCRCSSCSRRGHSKCHFLHPQSALVRLCSLAPGNPRHFRGTRWPAQPSSRQSTIPRPPAAGLGPQGASPSRLVLLGLPNALRAERGKHTAWQAGLLASASCPATLPAGGPQRNPV